MGAELLEKKWGVPPNPKYDLTPHYREWDPATNNVRTWCKTLDYAGKIRSVAPKPVTHSKNHHIFDAKGNYVGRR